MSLIFEKETGDCTGLDREDQTISTSKREESAKRYQATNPTPTMTVLVCIGN